MKVTLVLGVNITHDSIVYYKLDILYEAQFSVGGGGWKYIAIVAS